MSSNPPKDPQVFISYAHLDNQPVGEQPGWVKVFDETLTVYLGELLGEEPSIWRDQKINGNDSITPTILSSLSKAAVIVTVLSPRYVRSDWCLLEAQEFCKRNHGRHEARVFKVIKLPVKNEVKYFKDEDSFVFYNKSLHDLKGYQFFQIKDSRILPFRPELGPGAMQNYLAKIGDLAQDIAERIDVMAHETARGDLAAENVVVYLAETTADLTVEHDCIKRELTERKFTVLPDKPLPLDAEAFKKAVAEDLRRSRLSINLIGNDYGDSPIGGTQSIVELQNALATARANDPEFSHLIWIAPKPKPPLLHLKDFQQTRFVKELLDSNSEGITELVQDTIENLKTTILDRIKEPSSAGRVARGHKPAGSHLVYVICDVRDAQKGEEIREILKRHACEAVLPSVDVNQADFRFEHDELLKRCDSVLIYWGGATSFWVRLKLQDLQRIFGEGRTAPFRKKILYGGAVKTFDKENFLTNEVTYIKNFEDEITTESLSPLFQTISDAEGETA